MCPVTQEIGNIKTKLNPQERIPVFGKFFNKTRTIIGCVTVLPSNDGFVFKDNMGRCMKYDCFNRTVPIGESSFIITKSTEL